MYRDSYTYIHTHTRISPSCNAARMLCSSLINVLQLWQNPCCKYAKIPVSINQCWHRFLVAIYMHHD